jgi:hypothetical protein
LQVGDRYDDATGKLISSGSLKFSTHGTVSESNRAERERTVRAAVVDAQQRVDTVIGLLESAYTEKPRPKLTNAGVRQSLESSFPLFQGLDPGSGDVMGRFVPHILAVLRKVRVGLGSKETEIKLVGALSYWPTEIVDKMLGADTTFGWVNPDAGKSNDLKAEQPGPFREHKSAIYLNPSGDTAFTIIHEASHKYAGTEDYQYSPRNRELDEDRQERAVEESLASISGLDDKAKTRMLEQYTTARQKRRKAHPSKFGTPGGRDQPDWYALGQRALMNADSYAQFVMIATGDPKPRPADAPHQHAESEAPAQ